MNNRNYEDAKLKKELIAEKSKGKKSVKLRINKNVNQTISLIENWGGRVTPILYEITTKTFKNVNSLPSEIKEIHFAYKAGKKRICRKLKENEKAKLKKFNVYFRPVKFDINLTNFLHS